MTPVSLRNSRVAFTGKLGAITSQQAAEILRNLGAELVNNVSRLTSYLVVGMQGWPLLSDGSVSSKLRRAEELKKRGCRIEIISELRFLELANLRPAPSNLWKAFTGDEVCAALKVERETLLNWERFGLIHSVQGRYDFQDLVSLQTLAELLQRGVHVGVIATSLHRLASTLPGTDRPLAQLKIVAEHSSAILADFGRYRLAPTGQLCFNFDAASERATGILSLPDGEITAIQWFEAGQAYEEEEQYDQAADAYRRTIALDPNYAEAFFNLANVLRSSGDCAEAEAMYGRALECEPQMAAAWYNLADLQEELGQLDNAVKSLRASLAASPNYADAHFNLAACLEKLGRACQAREHWLAYLELDPDSTWADIARERASSLT
jgi:tetratricopeptide (TPR) repeat protein